MARNAIFPLYREAFREWRDDHGARLGAALSYYTIFSLAPILIIVIAIAGIVFGREAVEGRVFEEFRNLLGPGGAATVQDLLKGIANRRSGVVATVIGFATLLVGATGVLIQLQDALDTIWNVRRASSGGLVALIRNRLLSLSIVLAVGFLLIVSLVASSVISVFADRLGQILPGRAMLLYLSDVSVTVLFLTLLFGILFRYLPGVNIHWRDVWFGAASTAVLFAFGKTLFAIYISQAAPASTFGAAGSVVVILIWAYYCSQIVLYGAELTQVHARIRGRQADPKAGYVRLSAEKSKEK